MGLCAEPEEDKLELDRMRRAQAVTIREDVPKIDFDAMNTDDEIKAGVEEIWAVFDDNKSGKLEKHQAH